jgi:hypothetical protein
MPRMAEKPSRANTSEEWAWVDSSRRPRQRLETIEDWLEANRRSTTDLTLIRPTTNRPNPGILPYFHG